MKLNKLLKVLFAILVVGIIAFVGYKFIQDRQEPKVNANAQVSKEDIVVKEELNIPAIEVDTLNPIISNNRNVQEFSHLFYDGLVTLDSKMQVENQIAKEITKIDPLTYNIELKQVFFQGDNGIVTTKDVLFTIEQIKAHKGYYSSLVENIDLPNCSISSDTTMKIKLVNPEDFFEYNLTFPIMKKMTAEDFVSNEKNYVPICNGKYVFESQKENELKYVLNPKYYDKEFKPSIKYITVVELPSAGRAYSLFKTGGIDILTTKAQDLSAYIGNIGYTKIALRDRVFTFLAINNEKISKDYRKALYDILDQKKFTQVLQDNSNTYGYYPLDFGFSYFFTDRVTMHDENTAKIFFNKLEAKDKNVHIIVNDALPFQKALADKIIQILKEQGLNPTMEALNPDQYHKRIREKNYTFAITSITNPLNPRLSTYFAAGNFLAYQSEAMQKLLKDTSNIFASNKDFQNNINGMFAQIQTQFQQDVPFIPLARENYYMILKKGIVIDTQNINIYNIYTDIQKWYRR